MKKPIVLIIMLATLLFLTGCDGVDFSQLSDEDLKRISEEAVVCNEPYIRVGIECCLDKDGNNICDSDEMEPQVISEEEMCNFGFLEEYKCNGREIEQKYQLSDCSFEWYFFEGCSFGCEDGNCKSCEDSDGGEDYYTKGNIDYVGERYEDQCMSSTSSGLIEYYCERNSKDSELGLEGYDCPFGCSNGACNRGPSGYEEGIECSVNVYNCEDFNTQFEAWKVFEACGGISNDIHNLDGDDDGMPCESLP